MSSIDDIRKRFSNPAPKLEPRAESTSARSGLRDKLIAPAFETLVGVDGRTRTVTRHISDFASEDFPAEYLCPVDGKGGRMSPMSEEFTGMCTGSCGHHHETERFAKCRKCRLWVIPVEKGFERQWYCPKCRDVLLTSMEIIDLPKYATRAPMAELVDYAYHKRIERERKAATESPFIPMPPDDGPVTVTEIDITSEEGIEKAIAAGAIREWRCVHCGHAEYNPPDFDEPPPCCGVPMCEVR